MTLDLTVQSADPLGVLRSTAAVMQRATLVTIDEARIQTLAAQWQQQGWQRPQWDEQYHFIDGSPRTANWLLLVDALNFCFWGDPGVPRWRVTYQDTTLDGYMALAAALKRGVQEGHPLWDADYLAALTEAELGDILRPEAGGVPIPLFAERLANAREVGRVLRERFAGSCTHLIELAQQSAPQLARLVAQHFRSFYDVTLFAGQEVYFFKRAQIFAGDIFGAFQGTGWGALRDLDELTAFADYKVPQVLRWLGVLHYAPVLAERVDRYLSLPPGSQEEIEIRAATIWTVEWLRRSLQEQGAAATAMEVDWLLWQAGQQGTALESRPTQGMIVSPHSLQPYHRTRTIYY